MIVNVGMEILGGKGAFQPVIQINHGGSGINEWWDDISLKKYCRGTWVL